jgi:hypothetical protein
MPVLIVLEIGLQLLCAVHVIRTRRPYYWIFIIMGFPLLGSLAYAIAELLPDLMHSPQARNVASGAAKLIDPDRDYRALVEQLDTADTADNRRALAEECLRRGEAERAVLLYEASLTGAHKDDPTLMFGLARALFARGEFVACSKTLEALKAANPRFESADAHLLYARSLESQGRVAEARSEYDALVRYFPGAEARCRYALMLQQQGDTAGARRLFQEVVRALDKAGRRFIRDQREWYDLAKQHLG